jgi:hypothetical protein
MGKSIFYSTSYSTKSTQNEDNIHYEKVSRVTISVIEKQVRIKKKIKILFSFVHNSFFHFRKNQLNNNNYNMNQNI